MRFLEKMSKSFQTPENTLKGGHFSLKHMNNFKGSVDG